MNGEQTSRKGVLTFPLNNDDAKVFAAKVKGCLLITGPSGSGKSYLSTLMGGAHLDSIGREVDRRWIVDVDRLRSLLVELVASRKTGEVDLKIKAPIIFDVQCDNLIEVVRIFREVCGDVSVLIIRPTTTSWRQTCSLKSRPNSFVNLPKTWRDDFEMKANMSESEGSRWLESRVDFLVKILKKVLSDADMVIAYTGSFQPVKGWHELPDTSVKGDTSHD